jgi:hypothetical protein
MVLKKVKQSPKKMRAQKKDVQSYKKDFYKWTKFQANFLKQGMFEKLDTENLAEEIESLGKSERNRLESFLEILLMHMLKVTYQPEKHTKSWDHSIEYSRHKVKKVLKENPSLNPELKEILKEAYFSARLEAAHETGLDKKKFPKECPWTMEEILTK